jgi:primosomal protein N' (replication factor Y) (superfamily II helicase)
MASSTGGGTTLERVEVAVALPMAGTYTYSVPPRLAGLVRVGTRVSVPFGRRRAEGIVVGPGREAAPGLQVLPVGEALDEEASLDPELVRLLLWIADYYQAPPGEAVRLGLPPGLRTAEVRRFKLTAGGEQALAAHGAALTPTGLELDAAEVEVCELLRGGARVAGGLRRQRADATQVLARLVTRGLVEERVRAAGARPRPEVWVALARDPSPEEAARLARAPRRAAVLERVRAAGAEVRLADLGRAREHVAALEAAGLVRRVMRAAAAAGADDEAPTAGAGFTLTPEQLAAREALVGALGHGYAGFLLHGVTGSGKTEVYLELVRAVRERGQTAIVLVPEISLTPQLTARFRQRFGDDVAVLHSGLGVAERLRAWRQLREGRVGIAVGARSAIFAPVRDLGAIVVDEEHDPSFKQEEGVRYQARDVALVRAQQAGAVAVLGSATPSLESFANARSGRLRLLSLPHRVTPRPLPQVEVVDLRRYRPGREGLFSAPLVQAIGETLAFGDQAILFLNRRGFATSVLCTACGEPLRCRNCSVALTLHRAAGRLVCHYCSFTQPAPTRCPKCHAEELREVGTGTERVEDALREHFPDARVGRLDRDTARGRGLQRVLDGLRARTLDIVVGTQLVAKGHDFPGVTLVGVLMADTGLALPDFRAAERTFQLLTQVAGRAGRGERAGRVVVQTYSPDHPSVVCARGHDYEQFFATEEAIRRDLGYPPAGRVVLIRVEATSEAQVREAAALLGDRGRALCASTPGVTLLGPVEAPIPRLKGRYRWQLMLRGTERRPLHAVARELGRVELPPGVRRAVDIDPVSTL